MLTSPAKDAIAPRLNLDTRRVEFLAHYGEPPIKGAIDVDHLRRLIGQYEYADDLLDEFRERHIAFTSCARLKHEAGQTEADGSVFITEADLMP